MKKVILAVVLLVGLSSVSKAQYPGKMKPEARQERVQLSPQERASKEADRMEKELGLNADQKAKWQAAVLERTNANASVKEKMQGSTTPDERQQLRMQIKSNGEKFDNAVNAFLTSEQKSKYAEMKANRHQRGHKNMKQREQGPQNPR